MRWLLSFVMLIVNLYRSFELESDPARTLECLWVAQNAI